MALAAILTLLMCSQLFLLVAVFFVATRIERVRKELRKQIVMIAKGEGLESLIDIEFEDDPDANEAA